MDPVDLIGGAGTGGIAAALAYKVLALVEQNMKKRNGGTDQQSLLQSIDNLTEITRENGEELRNIKGLIYDVKAKQAERDAVERDRQMRMVK